MRIAVLLSGVLLLCLNTFAQQKQWLNTNAVMKKFGSPEGYYPNKNKGFSPVAKCAFPVENGKKLWRIYDVKGASGCRFDNYRKHPILSGDKFVVIARVRGKGAFYVCAQAYSNKKWMGYLGQKTVPVTAKWQTVQIPFDTKDFSVNHPTTSAFICVGASKGSDLYIESIQLQRVQKIAGSAAFPNIWNAFLPMDLRYKPTQKELTTIPRTLNGVKPRKVQFNGSEHDFKAEFGSRRGTLDKHGSGNCVWLFARIHAAEEQEYRIGAGADWWMTVYVNGKSVIDTSVNGNNHHPPRITDHQKSFRLKKGENIIAVKYVTGAGSMVLALGGPRELRNLGQKLRIVDFLYKDDFEKKDPFRSGKLRTEQGKYSFALVAPSRHGICESTSSVPFRIGGKKPFSMPKIVSGKHFAYSMRVVDLSEGAVVSFRSYLPGKGKAHTFSIERKPGAKDLTLTLSEKGRKTLSFSYPVQKLPFEFLFTADAKGECKLALETLVDSSVQYVTANSAFFSSLENQDFLLEGTLKSSSRKAVRFEMDNIRVGYAMPDVIKKQIALDVNVMDSFDPVKEKWPLTFRDEFNGSTIDPTKWAVTAPPGAIKIRNGIVEMTPQVVKRGGKVAYAGVGMTSYSNFGFGYYEARVRFRQYNKWITAFWLYGGQTGNSFLDGIEIDIYEDYYVTKDRPLLDFNYHGFVGRVMKSWNYVANIPGPLTDFYRIGVKWTPFELTYYINGKAIRSQASHSPHKTVTYDALNHRIGIVPLRICFKAAPNVRENTFPAGTELPPFPDTCKLDYIRFYAMPTEKAPTVKLTGKDTELMMNAGESFTLEAQVKPNAKTRAPIKGVYLFDSGCLIDYKTKPPYKFTVTLDEKYYSGSVYMRPGRSREEPRIRDVLHAYAVFAQDARGEVAHSEVVMKMTRPAGKSRPYQGKYQVVPGKVNPAFYDEGGNTVGYLDDNVNVMSKSFRIKEGVDTGGSMIGHVVTGEWQNLSIDVKKAGKYKVSAEYGAPVGFGGKLLLILNEKDWIGTLPLPTANGRGWGGLRSKEILVTLPAGKQKLKLLCVGAFNYSYLTFTAVK